jgi:hypothetical protein
MSRRSGMQEALAEGVASSLKLASIILVGTNDALLEATCKNLAQRMLYFPVQTKNTLQGRRNVASLAPIIEQEGWEALSKAPSTALILLLTAPLQPWPLQDCKCALVCCSQHALCSSLCTTRLQ